MKFNIGDRVFVKYFNKFGVISGVSLTSTIQPAYVVRFDFYPDQVYNIHEEVLLCATTIEFKREFEEMLGD